MSLLFASFVAGILTILAPCVLPILPVIIGGSITDLSRRTWFRPFVVVLSLAVSIFAFTLLLKASTSLLGVPHYVWQFVSGIIVIGLGLTYIFPRVWDMLSLKSGAALSSQQALSQASKRTGLLGAIVTGAALGPVFTSCSPTYLFIVAAVLPIDIGLGITYILAYVVGLAAVLLIVAVAGAKVVKKLRWSVNPEGWLKRTIGIVMILVGLAVLLGADKALQTFVIDQGWYAPVESIENSLR